MSEGACLVWYLTVWQRLCKHLLLQIRKTSAHCRAWQVAKIYAAKLVSEDVLSESEVAEPWPPEGELKLPQALLRLKNGHECCAHALH